MLEIAKGKVPAESVSFHIADIRQPWDFVNAGCDLVSFSLVLEHIEDLEDILLKAWTSLNAGGFLYIGELHPFKQYAGSKARYTTEAGEQIVPCFTHHLSHFIQPALRLGFTIIDVREYFDNDDAGGLPRILALLLVKMEE
jgi:SAM-dependent methyltransferase